MDDRKKRVSDEDLQAARRAIARNPLLAEFEPLEETELRLAELHREWGPTVFDAKLFAPDPSIEIERQKLALLLGRISFEEGQKNLDAHVQRPVDATMLEEFFSELQRHVGFYSSFMQAMGVSGFAADQSANDMKHVDTLAGLLKAKLRIFKKEMIAVIKFVQEARVAEGLPNAIWGDFTAPTAIQLIGIVADSAHGDWKAFLQSAQRCHPMKADDAIREAVTIFCRETYPTIPRPQELQVLLEQEWALGRLHIEERLNSQATSHVLKKVKDQPLLTVSSWPKLAIAVDAEGYWATTPVPQFGTPFRKDAAKELPLKGRRWRTVLNTLASEPDPSRLPLGELCRVLGRLPPPAANDAAMQARAERLGESSDDRKYFRDLCSDLNRGLKELVAGPDGAGTPPFSLYGHVIECRFVVRGLLSDASGHLRFGERRNR